jgi:hypothetical protein
MLSGSAGFAEETVPYSSPLFLDLPANNCGFNCAVFAASDLKLQITPDALKHRLGLDDQLFNALSLETLQKAFDEMHVGSVVLGGLNADSLFQLLDENQLAIVHLLSKRGHFVVIKKMGTQYAVMNFPAKELFEKARLATILNKHMTGYALILSPVLSLPKDIQSRGVSTALPDVNTQLLTASTAIRNVSGLENIAPTQGIIPAEIQHGSNIQFLSSVTADVPSLYDTEVKAEVDITNIGADELKILSITGECSCFRGESGPLTIAPNQKKVVLFRFDRSLFDFAQGTKVAIRCTDRLMPACLLKINPPKFDSVSQNVPDLICIPQIITVSQSQPTNPVWHFLFLIDKNYPAPVKVTQVLDDKSESLPFKVKYYVKTYYGQDYNAAELSLPTRRLLPGTSRFIVATDHPRDNKIPLSVIVEQVAHE